MKVVWVGLFAATMLSASTMVSVQCSVNNAGVVESKSATDPLSAQATCDAGPQLYANALGSAEFGPYSAFVRSSVRTINVIDPSSGAHSASASATTSYSDTVVIPATGQGFMQIDMFFPAGPTFSTWTTSFIFGSYSVGRSSGGPFQDIMGNSQGANTVWCAYLHIGHCNAIARHTVLGRRCWIRRDWLPANIQAAGQ
jgi:hypothetical protein